MKTKVLSLIILIVFATAVMSILGVGASALSDQSDLVLTSVEMYHQVPTNEVDYYVKLQNRGSVDHEQVKVRVILPEEGTYTSSRYFDIPAERSASKHLLGDAGVYPYNGWVTVRVSVSSDDVHKVYYRELLVLNGELIY
ncbi:hypothetical protein COY95_04495 [Candidatus Woesearchaeota archaeon CG_4_10_14_0_8_um_filter_47_5]|nr:MAG: hypothetical protein COY95_04495 [Candidatus Woesearchaeota archaeon CG_4_10_14_0_8_um_filter_47_5]